MAEVLLASEWVDVEHRTHWQVETQEGGMTYFSHIELKVTGRIGVADSVAEIVRTAVVKALDEAALNAAEENPDA